MARITAPRLLPITIFALAGLLAMKSVELVRVAAATVTQGQAVVAAAQAATPAAPEHPPAAAPSAQPAATPCRRTHRAPHRSVTASEQSCWSCASAGRTLMPAKRD